MAPCGARWRHEAPRGAPRALLLHGATTQSAWSMKGAAHTRRDGPAVIARRLLTTAAERVVCAPMRADPGRSLGRLSFGSAVRHGAAMPPIARTSTAGPSPLRARPASRNARFPRRRSASVSSLSVALDGAVLMTTTNEATANDAPVSFDGRTWADDSYWHPRREQRTAVRPPATASPGAFGCEVRA